MARNSSEHEPVQVACALGPEDGAQRLAQWRELAAVAGLGQTTDSGQVTLRFRDLPGVGSELEQLVSAETVCCDFLGWGLSRAGGVWHVVVSGTEEALRALPLG
jgi:hypothetical protein